MTVEIIKRQPEPEISTQQLSKLIRVGESTIADWRARGVGPAYRTNRFRIGKGSKFFYLVRNVLKYTGGRWPKNGYFIKTAQAARLLGVTPGNLRQMRKRGTGPVPVYFEALVRYLPEDCHGG